MTETGAFHIHLISDSTGETLHAMARAALAPFGDTVDVEVHHSVFLRSERELAGAMTKIRDHPGPVWFTLVDPAMRNDLEIACAALGLRATGVLDPLIEALAGYFQRAPSHRPGMQHRFAGGDVDRIAALDYAISHDDGAKGDALGPRLRQADVILTGISRTSKTPTCIYLAYRGVKAANVPLVPGRPPPAELIEAIADGAPVVALSASPSRLVQVRRNRLESLGQPDTADYADLARIRTEVADARMFFQRHHIPVIDVTRRSIEETAAAILAVLRDHDDGLPAARNDSGMTPE